MPNDTKWKSCRALRKLTFDVGRAEDGEEEGDNQRQPVIMETSMIVADLSGRNIGADAAKIIAALLPKCW